MGKIWKFKNGNKTIYAVTGEVDSKKAVRAVIRYKKESLSSVDKFDVKLGVLVKKKDQWELWLFEDKNKGKPCWIVTRK